jgi:type II secretory pathway pseudopilin PulG
MPKKRNYILSAGRRQRGFSAIEMLVAVVLLMAVLGVVVKGMTDMQRRSFSETSKMDAVQDTRDFIDQMVRDVHDVGYPPPRAIGVVNGVANATPYCTDPLANGVVTAAVRNDVSLACGIISYSPTSIVYEADLDGTGTVSVVFLNLVANGGNCPCTLQRGVVTKQQWVANNAIVPQYFTTVNGVMNSGNGGGAATFPLVVTAPGNYASYATADVFDAFDANALPIAVPCTLGTVGTPGTNPDCSQIRSLQITVNVAPAYADPTTKQFPVYSITSKARINY